MKDEKLDSLFRDSVNNLEGLPPQVKNWNMDSTFDKIQDGLQKQGNRKFPGIFDLAAAITVMLFAAGTLGSYIISQYAVKEGGNLFLSQATEELASEVQEASLSPVEDKQVFFSKATSENQSIVHTSSIFSSGLSLDSQNETELLIEQPVEITALATSKTSKPSSFESKGFGFAMPVSNLFTKNSSNVLDGLSLENSDQQSVTIPKLKVSVPIGLAMVNKEFGAYIGAKFSYQKVSETKPQVTLASATVSNYGLLGENTEGKSTLSNNVFLEASFGKRNISTGKAVTGHEVGVGMLLNPSSSIFDSRAIKINYSLNIKNKFNISPEVILTENLSQAIAGIKLSLG
ncbi:hypothetical protein R9C00_00205 [Flammeovirgaceae bacterium SG7u.111]|nr:hypothetical protein [Flammeovirgaceae bacterium SG7u.132]WPO35875.1 hypothetical protein R9C00_00205 [Flammeovirgaceae bacterium SG7u.111]